jgi:hypothetical protein
VASSKRNHKNRLPSTLILLMLSMTAGAAILNWLQAQTSPTVTRGESTTLMARTVQPWRTIEINTWTQRSSAIPFHHIYVDEQGHEFTSLAWRREQQDPEHSGTIHVLLAPAPGGGIPMGQWQSLLSRVQTLRARFGVPANRIVINPSSPDLDRQAQQDLRELAQMLRAAGLVG